MKVAWVTGGGTGIGRALAEALYREGYWVAISGRRREMLEDTARKISAITGRGEIHVLQADITDSNQVKSAIEALARPSGKLHLLINNAGDNPHHSFQETSLEEFKESFNINCLSAVRIVKEVLPLMWHGEGATIVNVSSILGKWASAGSPAYSVSKYAMTGFTDMLRPWLVGTGIHVMGVYPGFIQTAMTAPFVQPGSIKAHFAASPESMARAILKGVRRQSAEVHYPWYVPWLLRFHRAMPQVAAQVAHRVKH